MITIDQFFEEMEELFGYYLHVDMSIGMAPQYIEKLYQESTGIIPSDDIDFMVKDGPLYMTQKSKKS